MKARRCKSRPNLWYVPVRKSVSSTGKRENKYFKSLNAANEWISRFKYEQLEHGRAQISGEERRWINFFRDQVGSLELLPKVVEHWKSTGPDHLAQTTVKVAVKQFLDWRPHQGRWSRSTAEDTCSRLGIFERSFSQQFIHELTAADIEHFLVARGAIGTRAKFFQKLRPLFRYAKRHRFIAIDPFEHIQAPSADYQEIQIYTPLELQKMLTVAEEFYPDMIPFLSCMAFGFLRTEELIPRFAGDAVLDWSAFDWTDRQIFVPHAVAKKAKKGGGNNRSIPFNPALSHWIGPYVKESGPIVERNKADALRTLKKIRAKAGVRNLANALRHSCQTYWMSANGDESIGTVSRWAGNSPAVCKRHYLEVVKRSQGAAWLAIRRS
jgi:integrase